MSEKATKPEFETKVPTYDNVFLFGAGVSAAAGIPLLKPFLDKMWEYSVREATDHELLKEEDLKILREAHKIRVELERYNSRAKFNDRNLEDVLSLLSLESLQGEKAQIKYKNMVSAVARTIELACSLRYQDQSGTGLPKTTTIYHDFWRTVFTNIQRLIPAIMTFNYDLVLERALYDCFHFAGDAGSNFNVPVRLKYFHATQFAMIPEACDYGSTKGLKPKFVYDRPDTLFGLEIPYFKLHGSLNWPVDAESKMHGDLKPGTVMTSPHPPTRAVENPVILPPVFNKLNTTVLNSVWSNALTVLRNAKNIIIVGYSLPRTDIYMQYFLKSAVGPNSNLQKITVFDPVLFKNSDETKDMERRYQDCFSDHFSNGYIEFRPPHMGFPHNKQELPGFRKEAGTFGHFVSCLNHDNNANWEHAPLLF